MVLCDGTSVFGFCFGGFSFFLSIALGLIKLTNPSLSLDEGEPDRREANDQLGRGGEDGSNYSSGALNWETSVVG